MPLLYPVLVQIHAPNSFHLCHWPKCGTRANQLFKMKHGTYGGLQKASKMSFTLLGEILCQVFLKLMAKSDFEKLQNTLDLNLGMLDK